MKKYILLFIILTLSISTLIGCSNNSEPITIEDPITEVEEIIVENVPIETIEETTQKEEEFPTSSIADLDNRQEKWGVGLTAKNISPKGLTIVCEQANGQNVAELSTGSYYIIQRLEDSGFVDVEYLPQEYEIGWTAEAWIIKKNDTTTWDVNWEWLYGELPIGEYRIGKEIMNFRETGDFDKEMIYAHFAIN